MLREGLIATGFVFCLGITLAILLESAHRRSEESLAMVRATNENLERLVSERTQALEAATAHANAATKAKSDFLSNMTHEIRTPLHAIIGSSELLMESEDLPHDAREKSRMIVQSRDMLMKQIDEILDLSNIEAGQIQIAPKPCQLETLVKDCVGLMQSDAQKRGVSLLCKLSPELPTWCKADGLGIRQVLLNLLSNAIKFTQAGGSVELDLGMDDEHRVRFEVRDTGMGMSATAIGKIFQRFSQADPSITRDFGGTGLGLAICADLVELMGGRIEVESQRAKVPAFAFH